MAVCSEYSPILANIQLQEREQRALVRPRGLGGVIMGGQRAARPRTMLLYNMARVANVGERCAEPQQPLRTVCECHTMQLASFAAIESDRVVARSLLPRTDSSATRRPCCRCRPANDHRGDVRGDAAAEERSPWNLNRGEPTCSTQHTRGERAWLYMQP